MSASKRGRPTFTRLVAALKLKKNAGLIIPKIDRGSGNLRDGADIGELMDVESMCISHTKASTFRREAEGLSADILAVVAADCIRNLREEVVKGINGRLRQGLFHIARAVNQLLVCFVRSTIMALKQAVSSSNTCNVRNSDGTFAHENVFCDNAILRNRLM